jgi:hypothetical protein
MGTWLARVHFPDGKVLYASFSTVVMALTSRLHAQFTPEGGTDDRGQPCHRACIAGEALPHMPDAPLSGPETLVPVRIEAEPDRIGWTALYCPARQQIIGPHGSGNIHELQWNCELVLQGGRHHLVPAFRPDDVDHTFCGEAVTGASVPFHNFRRMPGDDTPEPESRDLHAEWSAGQVCRACLLHPLALNHGHETHLRRLANAPAAPVVVPVLAAPALLWWKRLLSGRV